MSHEEATALRQELEKLVIREHERTDVPVEVIWRTVSDIAIDRSES